MSTLSGKFTLSFGVLTFVETVSREGVDEEVDRFVTVSPVASGVRILLSHWHGGTHG